MGIQEVTSKHNTKLVNAEGSELHRVWELSILGNVLLLERYGNFCGWSELKLKKKGVEVYRIAKPWGSEERIEYFFNQPTRVYVGNQFSFIEYIAQIAEHKRFPTTKECAQAGLETNVEKQYRNNLQKILNIEASPSN